MKSGAFFIAAVLTWVLWEKTQIFGSLNQTNWGIEAAFENKKECERELRNKILEASQMTQDPEIFHEVVKNGMIWWEGLASPGKGRSHITLICLPDTLDPRPRFKE